MIASPEVIEWTTPVPGSEAPPPVFTLVNVGSEPTRILSVETSCGCANPSISTRSIGPGEQSKLTITPTGLATGSTEIAATIRTDSAATPVVHLKVRVEGWRRPPFIARVDGTLLFRRGHSQNSLIVQTIETGDQAEQPIVESTSPWIMVSEPRIETNPATSRPGDISRSYQYDVSLNETAPPEAFAAEVRVTDPWEPTISHILPVRVESRSPIEVRPKRLVLSDEPPGMAEETRFLLWCSGGTCDPAFSIRAGISPVNDLHVEPIEAPASPGWRWYKVSMLRPLPPELGTLNIEIRCGASPSTKLTIPLLRSGGVRDATL